jgi:hypothetical protein
MAGGLFGGGTGTSVNPYLVEDSLDLNAVRNNSSLHYKQTTNIDMNGYPSFVTIPTIGGSYDGNNFSISNLTKQLFGTCSGTIKNVNLLLLNIFSNPSDGALGSLVSTLLNLGTVINCTAKGIVTHDPNGSAYQNVGGLVGAVSGIIKRSWFDGIVRTIGTSSRNISIGGLVGSIMVGGSVLDSHSKGLVESTNTMIPSSAFHGGFCGTNSGQINRCYSTSEVISRKFCGGFLGNLSTGITKDCYCTGQVTSLVDTAGGFIGTLDGAGTIENCYATGSVFSKDRIAGFSGYQTNASAIVKNCYTLSPTINRMGGGVGNQISRFLGGGSTNANYVTGAYVLSTMEFRDV